MNNNEKPTNSPGIIIMQWLSYAFWGWLILSLIWLMSIILSNAILGDPVYEAVPYAIAASVVLLPIAFVCDFFYRKYEPTKKSGIAMVIMVIHAVIFALLGIGALIIAVFTMVNASITTSGSIDTHLVTIFTSLLATAMYGATFLRTLNPFKSSKPSLIYGLSMLLLTVTLIIFAIAGPLAKSYTSRDDRRIDSALRTADNAITSYVGSNNELPASLDILNFEDDNSTASDVVADGLIEYIPEGKVEDKSMNSRSIHRYQLCANYKSSTIKSGSSSNKEPRQSDEYSTYLSIKPHAAERVCYKLQTSSYLYDY